MAAKLVSKHGGEVVVEAPGSEHYRAIFKPYNADVIDNGDGTFSIPSITDAQDLDIAFTRETQACYEYDSTRKVWWKWSV